MSMCNHTCSHTYICTVGRCTRAYVVSCECMCNMACFASHCRTDSSVGHDEQNDTQ